MGKSIELNISVFKYVSLAFLCMPWRTLLYTSGPAHLYTCTAQVQEKQLCLPLHIIFYLYSVHTPNEQTILLVHLNTSTHVHVHTPCPCEIGCTSTYTACSPWTPLHWCTCTWVHLYQYLQCQGAAWCTNACTTPTFCNHGDDGHLLEERHGGGKSYHLLGNDSLTSPEEGHQPFILTGSC